MNEKRKGIFSSLLSNKEFRDRFSILITFFLANGSMPRGLLPLNVQEFRENKRKDKKMEKGKKKVGKMKKL